MKLNKQDQDGEEVPIMESDNFNMNYSDKVPTYKKIKKKVVKKKKWAIKIMLQIIVFILIYLLLYLYDHRITKNISNLEQKLENMETKINGLSQFTVKKKMGIGIVQSSLYGNGIGRIISILTELLAKTGKYDVYLINERIDSGDFPCYKEVKRVVQKKDKKEIEEFDKLHNIEVYILNNDISEYLEIYKSLGKKVIGVFHGVFYSCIFTNHSFIYNQWYRYSLFDSFVQIIADDYWIYDKFNFQNTIFIPNLYTFEHSLTPSSPLTYKNVLIVGRIDDVIKGAEFGVRAMGEVIKKVPDAQLYIVSGYYPPNIINLIKELNYEKNVHLDPFSKNISEYYLNASVLLVASVSESFPMVMNEGKAHGLPIVAFNIDYSPSFQKGVITVDLFDYKAMGDEIVKLLNDYNYRKEKGKEAKLSLDMFKNNETIATWGELFSSLTAGEDEYKKLQQKIRKKYYNEKIAEERMKRHYRLAQQFNKQFSCHSFEQFTNLNYLNRLKECQI